MMTVSSTLKAQIVFDPGICELKNLHKNGWIIHNVVLPPYMNNEL